MKITLNNRNLSWTPGRAGRVASRIYRPSSVRGRFALRLVRMSGAVGFHRLQKRQIPMAIRSTGLGGGISRYSSSEPDRWIYGIADDARLMAVAKYNPGKDAGIERESEFYRIGRRFNTFSVPAILPAQSDSDSLVIYESAPGGSTTDLNLVIPVLVELRNREITHGDFAPWNVLSHAERIQLIDWEAWRDRYIPYWDICTFVYKPFSLLRMGTPTEFLTQILAADGPLSRFDEACGIRGSYAWADELAHYLRSSHPEPPSHHAATFRKEVLERLS